MRNLCAKRVNSTSMIQLITSYLFTCSSGIMGVALGPLLAVLICLKQRVLVTTENACWHEHTIRLRLPQLNYGQCLATPRSNWYVFFYGVVYGVGVVFFVFFVSSIVLFLTWENVGVMAISFVEGFGAFCELFQDSADNGVVRVAATTTARFLD